MKKKTQLTALGIIALTTLGAAAATYTVTKLAVRPAVRVYQPVSNDTVNTKGKKFDTGALLLQRNDADFTRGTLEGDIAPSDITFYRLQCDSEGNLRSYIAEGEILPVATRSFGGIAIFGIHEMGRFYRHVLVQKRYPHHGAVAFGHYGKILFEVLKFLGIQDIAYNQPKSLPYPTENPFA